MAEARGLKGRDHGVVLGSAVSSHDDVSAPAAKRYLAFCGRQMASPGISEGVNARSWD